MNYDDYSAHTEIDELKRRCDKKEKIINDLQNKYSVLDTKIVDLMNDNVILTRKIESLSAWKNRAVGYLSGIALVIGAIVELFREKFFEGN